MGLSFMSLLRGLLFLICLLCPIYDKDVLYADMKCQSPGHRFHPSLLDTERRSICVKDKVIALANPTCGSILEQLCTHHSMRQRTV